MNDPIGGGVWRPAALERADGPAPPPTAVDADPARWLGELPEAGAIAGAPSAGHPPDPDAAAARVLAFLGPA